MIKKTALTLLAVFLPMGAFAAGSGYHLENAPSGLNERSLQRGARHFINYCMGCHSLEFMRYNRLAKDLNLDEGLLRENFIFTYDKNDEQDKIGVLMNNAMNDDYAKKAFGVVPPDLSLIARSRGADWLYTYMKTFYVDDTRPFGFNNAVYPAVGMPHVLWELEGTKKAIIEVDESEKEHIVGFEQISEGKMSADEYDKFVGDLVKFLVYAGEPAKLHRYKIGMMVLFYLFIFAGVAYWLKKEYWKDIR